MDGLDIKGMWFLSIIIMFGVSCHLRNKSGVFSDKDMKSYVNLYIAFSSILFFLCVFIPDPRYIDPSDYIYLFFFGILFVGLLFLLGCILFSKMSWKTKLHALYPELESCLFGLLIINFIIILILMWGGILFILNFFEQRLQAQRLQKQRQQKQRQQAQRKRRQTTTPTANFDGLINV